MPNKLSSAAEKWQTRALTLANIAYTLMALVFLAFGPVLLIFALTHPQGDFSSTFVPVAITMFAFPLVSFIAFILYLVAFTQTIKHKLPAERQKVLILAAGALAGAIYISANTLITVNAPMTGANPYWTHTIMMFFITIVPLGLVYCTEKPNS